MEQLEPGSLIQYQGSLSPPPSWPAVVCTDDMAPKDLLRSRPRGVSTILILILGSLTFRWATPKDLSEYDPFMPILQGQMVARVPGLGDAYGMANNHLDSSLDLEYWRERVGGTITIDSDLELDSEDSMDTEFQQALRASRDDYLRKNPASRSLLTPSQSPPIVLPSPQVSRTAATQNSTRFFGVPLPNNTIDLTDEEVPTDETPKRTEPATKPLSQQTCILDTTNLSSIFNKPTSDTIDGELTQSKHFIHVPVGPKSQLRVLPQQSLWNRPYFRDPRRGLNHFDYIDNTWILRHPALRHINPADFDFAAEYLESDDFGIRLPLDPLEQQGYAAWSVADRLDMHDLMEHVVDKLEGITPGRDEMMVFACRIFGKKGGGDLPGHYRLKEYLARFIAEDWWGYVRELGEWFVERLEGLPELERDVCEKRLEALNERLDREEEEEEEVEGGEDMEID
ncbi:hypothetical protein COCCADRAFT_1876 [Bipolaris zeicola 26-R-13]|uniref:Uncharacterized protein n=1 Tax=Cochliobolus carbonum (strain 26-R-13) TaxID=930089 RepID=W6YNI8_COCC2|nr:uncharacterized protein COCCADRAFT_1876 [Bipolaris zeicola 26-R-13]EUC37094.1 hypothetical protein COCCADRAFT_1876 [Bipolaris zeicola 26-R-13]